MSEKRNKCRSGNLQGGHLLDLNVFRAGGPPLRFATKTGLDAGSGGEVRFAKTAFLCVSFSPARGGQSARHGRMVSGRRERAKGSVARRQSTPSHTPIVTRGLTDAAGGTPGGIDAVDDLY